METPVRLPTVIPEAHMGFYRSGEWFLQTSPEICMKRLVACGHNKIFQICRCFRKGERGALHLPEFTMLEWYACGETYHDMMTTCTDLLRYVAAKVDGRERFVFQGGQIDLSGPWDRIKVAACFENHARISLEKALETGRFDDIMGFDIEPRLGMEIPVFLYDYPARLSPLAKRKPDRPDTAERFELYIAGLELANGFSELADPEEQRERLAEQLDQRREMGRQGLPVPEKFLADLAAMPETAGTALGIDRLVMLVCDLASIDRAVAFPPERL